MKYKPYPKYKDSGVEWLGKIPEGWNQLQLRHLVTCLDGRRIPLSGEERSTRKGEYAYWGANGVVDFIDSYLFDEELVLLGEDGAPFFDKTKPVAFFVSEPIWVNNHIHILKPISSISAQFLVWSLNSVDYGNFIEGSTRDKLTQSNMLSISLALPSISIQRAIATFLDTETARIDSLVKDYEELIALLKEKRQALVSHAVTRGLSELVRPDDPEFGEWAKPVKFKDSGVEWIGEIPEGWEVMRISRLYFEVAENGQEDLPILSVSIHSGVSDRELREDELERKVTRSDDREKYKRVAPNDLTYNMMRAWQGGFGAVSIEGMVSPAYVVARPKQSFSSVFFEMVLRTPQAIEQMRILSRGVTDFRLRLYWDEFKTIQVPLPMNKEQKSILYYLDKKTAKMDMLVNEAEAAIELLKEHRSALITNTVTGKINVEALV